MKYATITIILLVIAVILSAIAFSNPAESRFMEIEYTFNEEQVVIDYQVK